MSIKTVEVIHQSSLNLFRGLQGVRSRDLLESAVEPLKATFGGEFLHEDVFAMAAAYLFHIVKNHPFIDGNRRAGLGVALAVLDRNGFPIERASNTLDEITIAVAEGRLEKPERAVRLGELAGTGA